MSSYYISLLLCIFTLSAHATVYYVDTAISSGGAGTSWATSFKYLQDALTAATNGDEIRVAQGTYYPDEGTGKTNNSQSETFTLKTGVAIYGGYPTGGSATRNWISNVTILSGEIQQDGNLTNNSNNVVKASSVAASAILDGFTIRDGYIPPPDSCANNIGAGVLLSNSSPVLNNLIITNNTATCGGGLYAFQGTPTLTNVMFLNNISTSGGGIYAHTSSYTLRNVVFRGNSASSLGGGIYNFANTPNIINATFSNNTAPASSGGGIYNWDASPSVKNSIIWGNTGGEINNIYASSPTVTYSIVQGGYTGIGNLSVDPKFMSATDLRLQPTSPAIDAGNNSLVSSGITTDLIGNPRFYDVTIVADTGVGTAPIVDIGAYEMQAAPIPASVDNKLALFFVSLGILVMVGFNARTKLTG
jgi:predicted outer membrane repeat protein